MAAIAEGLAHTLSPLVAAAIGLTAGAALTGALHLDALADAADALTKRGEAALAIMRDHSIGAYGATALFLDLLVKAAALAALVAGAGAVGPAVAAGALARAVPLVVASALPPVREEGIGASVASRVSRTGVAAAVAVGDRALPPCRPGDGPGARGRRRRPRRGLDPLLPPLARRRHRRPPRRGDRGDRDDAARRRSRHPGGHDDPTRPCPPRARPACPAPRRRDRAPDSRRRPRRVGPRASAAARRPSRAASVRVALYSSPMVRALETARPLATLLGIEPEIVPISARSISGSSRG